MPSSVGSLLPRPCNTCDWTQHAKSWPNQKRLATDLYGEQDRQLGLCILDVVSTVLEQTRKVWTSVHVRSTHISMVVEKGVKNM